MRHRVMRRLAALVASLLFMFMLTAAPVRVPFLQIFGAATASAACNLHTVYSDANKGGFHGSFCSDDNDLSNNQATPLGWCSGPFDSSWNNCISSVEANLTGATQICLWSNTNYNGNGLKILPGSVGWWNMPAWLNDAISSIEIASSDCFVAGNQP